MKHKENDTIKYGFTLVELLLGMVITAIIGLTVYNMFWQSMKLDDKMRRVHENYTEILMANQAMTHDLENAITIDFSASYPGSKIFDGQTQEFSFLTQTPKGIRRVRYYSGLYDQGAVTREMIGRVVNLSSKEAINVKGSLPVEFLLRQESSLADWLNETTIDTSVQIVAAGLKKESFSCRYAPYVKNLHTTGSKGIDYKDSWEDKGLPLSVSCNFVLYDPKNPQQGLMFRRDMFLAPVKNFYNEQ